MLEAIKRLEEAMHDVALQLKTPEDLDRAAADLQSLWGGPMGDDLHAQFITAVLMIACYGGQVNNGRAIIDDIKSQLGAAAT